MRTSRSSSLPEIGSELSIWPINTLDRHADTPTRRHADTPTRRHALLVLGVFRLTNRLVIVGRIKFGPISAPGSFFQGNIYLA
jgi:hypothetical protein